MIENRLQRIDEKFVIIQEFSPNYYDNDPIMTSIYLIEAEGLVDAEDEELDIIRQMSPHTATWGIVLWENDLSIRHNVNDTLELRRSRVLNKLYALTPMTTRAVLEKIVNLFIDSKRATVVEVDGEYVFYINLPNADVGQGALEAIHFSVEEIKPAHLAMYYRIFSEIRWLIERRMRSMISHRVKFPGPHLLPINGSVPIDGTWSLDGKEIEHVSIQRYKVSRKFGSPFYFPQSTVIDGFALGENIYRGVMKLHDVHQRTHKVERVTRSGDRYRRNMLHKHSAQQRLVSAHHFGTMYFFPAFRKIDCFGIGKAEIRSNQKVRTSTTHTFKQERRSSIRAS